jgi:hypothetical protein
MIGQCSRCGGPLTPGHQCSALTSTGYINPGVADGIRRERRETSWQRQEALLTEIRDLLRQLVAASPAPPLTGFDAAMIHARAALAASPAPTKETP